MVEGTFYHPYVNILKSRPGAPYTMMWKQTKSVACAAILCVSLFAFDTLLGNGCMITLRDHLNTLKFSEVADTTDFSITVFILEIIALQCIAVLLNRYKTHGIEHSEVVSQKPSELLETKNRSRTSQHSKDYDPQEINDPRLIKPLDLEMPVLQMAIIDTIGTTRSQPERGDAGDIYKITDSAILSITSLLDTGFKLQESLVSLPEDNMVLGDGNIDQVNTNRYLWAVVEED